MITSTSVRYVLVGWLLNREQVEGLKSLSLVLDRGSVPFFWILIFVILESVRIFFIDHIGVLLPKPIRNPLL